MAKGQRPTGGKPYVPAWCYLCGSAHMYQYACDLIVIYRADRGLTDWQAETAGKTAIPEPT